MLTITGGAAEAVKNLCEQSGVPDGGGLRIFSQPINEQEASLELSLAESPEGQDLVVDAEGASVFLEPAAAAYLSDKVLDASIEEETVKFSIGEQGQDA